MQTFVLLSGIKLDYNREKKKSLMHTSAPSTSTKNTTPSNKMDAVQEDPTAMFLAELEDHIENSKKEGQKPQPKPVGLMTPEEVLACHYLRLNQDQVARLEQCIRERGQDPGIHVHMDVTNYDVFSEIRRIRQAQNTAATFEVYPDDEEDEENVAQNKLKPGLLSQPPSKPSSNRHSASSTKSSLKTPAVGPRLNPTGF
ncbi:hypothetical protein ElyMa_001226900 [Elysia marginata]|uniref:Uncharacterized protein n=1 Tax=Elysia marginata TaxID=1093978 RepID=A0AAV4I8A8_9GAST|nr:hypothetical protein ElyMa_001226900 [Elysia marginata]